MKKIILAIAVVALVSSCKKEENKTSTSSTLHSVEVVGHSLFDSHVTIDGVDQGQIDHIYQISNGQSFTFIDYGDDAFSPITMTTTQAYINVTVYVDGVAAYTHGSYSDAVFTYNP
jgi:hypothetical protein